jgi:hypothetical protein
MNGMDEFAVEATVIFAAIIGLVFLLTYLEASLLQPDRRQPHDRRRFRLRRQLKTGADAQLAEPVDEN